MRCRSVLPLSQVTIQFIDTRKDHNLRIAQQAACYGWLLASGSVEPSRTVTGGKTKPTPVPFILNEDERQVRNMITVDLPAYCLSLICLVRCSVAAVDHP
jgi:hypothetical protein